MTPELMGILNVTPDSFSDGGQFTSPQKAVEHGVLMREQGALIIDVGGESTRPGSERVDVDEQKKRVLKIIAALAKEFDKRNCGAVISIDTTRAAVAEAALDAGATMLNDISAGRDDPAILELAVDRRVPICLMHMQGDPKTMQDAPHYDDVVDEVLKFLSERVEYAVKKGIAQDKIVIDPGIGFGKTAEDNLRILKSLDEFVELGLPVLLGASRKRFISAIGRKSEPHERIAGSCATTIMGYLAGVKYFRVHDVAEHKQALDVCRAIQNS